MPRLITGYLENTSIRFPDKVAVVDEKGSMTFGELRDKARRIASALAGKGIFHQPVAVFLEQGAEAIACFLGTAYSGNFYTVLDTKMPRARLQKIIDVLHPSAIVTDEEHFSEWGMCIRGGQKSFCTKPCSVSRWMRKDWKALRTESAIWISCMSFLRQGPQASQRA